MTAQIIDFPMDRVRQPVVSSSNRANQTQFAPLPVRTSVKVARFVLFFSLVCTLLGFLFVNSTAGLSPAQANSEVGQTSSEGNFAYITVMSGETLWSIAQRYAPNQDPRDFIANLVALNNLNGTVLTPGMQLALPLK